MSTLTIKIEEEEASIGEPVKNSIINEKCEKSVETSPY